MSGKDVGIAIRADSTIEEGVGALALAEHLGTGQIDHAPRSEASVIAPLAQRATLTDLATADAIFVAGDVTEEAGIVDLRIKDALKGVTPPELMAHGVPIADLRLKERQPRNERILSVAAPYRVDLMRYAGLALRHAPGQEAAMFQDLEAALNAGGPVAGGTDAGKAERSGHGVPSEDLRAAAERMRQAERPVVVLTGSVLASKDATSAALAFAKAAGAKLMLIGPMANSHGLELMGVLPSHANYAYPAMLETARALVLSHLDPAQDPDVAERLKQKDLLVVHDSFLTETAAIADVVLPARTVYERDGTVVNLEGRFLKAVAAPVEGGASEDLTGVVKRLGDALGQRLEGRSVRSAHRVLRQRMNIDLAELPEWGEILDLKPVTPRKDAGAPAREETVKRRGGNIVVTASMVRPEYAYLNRHLLAERGGPTLRVNPADAQAHGLTAGDDVRLRVNGMWRRATVKVTEDAPAGLMTIPATADQPQGLAHADLSTLAVLREREAVA